MDLPDKNPSLRGIVGCDGVFEIEITNSSFTIGRGLNNSCVIPELELSRQHCTIFKEECWKIQDSSAFGTFVNNTKMKKGEIKTLNEGDIVKLGPNPSKLIYRFTLEKDSGARQTEPPLKRLKSVTEVVKLKSNDENLKQEIELKNKLKELEDKLKEKEQENLEIQKKLEQTEIEKVNEINELKEKQEKEKTELLATLTSKEANIRTQLENQLQQLQAAKDNIEQNIQNELAKKENESSEHINKLTEELNRVRQDLETVGGKKQMLESELENLKKHEIDNKETYCQAKNDVLTNFSEVLETELQCPICNELFINTTTLNCKHTFCQFCIKQWQTKKNECPVCRAKITSSNQTLVLDNFIEKIVASLPNDLRNRRDEMIKERLTANDNKSKKKRKKNKPNTRAQATYRENLTILHSDERASTSNTISSGSSDSSTSSSSLSSSSDSSTSSTSTTSTTSSDHLSDHDYFLPNDLEEMDLTATAQNMDNNVRTHVPGVPGAYYGGYGYCYSCGASGHWANGCPTNPTSRRRYLI